MTLACSNHLRRGKSNTSTCWHGWESGATGARPRPNPVRCGLIFLTLFYRWGKNIPSTTTKILLKSLRITKMPKYIYLVALQGFNMQIYTMWRHIPVASDRFDRQSVKSWIRAWAAYRWRRTWPSGSNGHRSSSRSYVLVCSGRWRRNLRLR